MTTGTMATPMTGGDNTSSFIDSDSIWNRYEVRDDNGSLVNGKTFVLHLTDPYAKPALLAYARAIQNDVPDVATQIWESFPDEQPVSGKTF